jgi:hypothetical protein
MVTTIGVLDGYSNGCSTQIGCVPLGAVEQPKPPSGAGLGKPQISAVYWPGVAQRGLRHAVAEAPHWPAT